MANNAKKKILHICLKITGPEGVGKPDKVMVEAEYFSIEYQY